MDEGKEMIGGLARAGYTAKGILYGTIGILAAAAAFGSRGGSTDSRGAMAAMLHAPFGRTMLFLIAAGLAGYAVWRVMDGILDLEKRGSDAKALILRATFVARGLVHAGLSWSAWKLATYRPSGGGSGAAADQWTAKAFHLPGGRAVVVIVALSFALFGGYQIFRAVTGKLSDRLDTGRASAGTGRWILGVSRFGIAARGLVFVAIGVLFLRAVKQGDASKAGGIGEALGAINGVNHFAFAATALGLIAYGVYQLINARYRRIVSRA